MVHFFFVIVWITQIKTMWAKQPIPEMLYNDPEGWKTQKYIASLNPAY